MSGRASISRRAALARLGLGISAIYVSPAVTGLSAAHASSGPSDGSAPSPASPASAPSAPSRPSRPSGPSAASGVDAASTPSGAEESERRIECRVPGKNGGVRISRDDYQRVQRAIRRGEARPLREVLQETARKYPGQPVRVGLSSKGSDLAYRIQIVTPSGDIVSLTVDARSGAIVQAWTC